MNGIVGAKIRFPLHLKLAKVLEQTRKFAVGFNTATALRPRRVALAQLSCILAIKCNFRHASL